MTIGFCTNRKFLTLQAKKHEFTPVLPDSSLNVQSLTPAKSKFRQLPTCYCLNHDCIR